MVGQYAVKSIIDFREEKKEENVHENATFRYFTS
jgi:hypothetical protein